MANTSSPTSSVFCAIRTIASIRSASLGVSPDTGSRVMSLTEKIPNCMTGLLRSRWPSGHAAPVSGGWGCIPAAIARGRDDEARVTLHEAVSLYDGLQAAWDIRRAGSRLRAYGIRLGVRGQRGARATSGWDALTATEVKIAAMVAGGAATPDIARGMFLSRRTVQTHISHILAKLGAKGRVDIVREALRQGVSA